MGLTIATICILIVSAQQVIADEPSPVVSDGSCNQEYCHNHPQQTKVSAVLQVSSADIEAKQETSFTLKSACEAKPVFNTTQTCCKSRNHCNTTDIVKELKSLQQTVNELKTVVAELSSKAPCPVNKTDVTPDEASPAYPVVNEDGARWRLFWWYTDTTWPDTVTDVLQDKYGDCEVAAANCFGRLPEELEESKAEMLGTDSAENVYRWAFDPSNDVAHAVWEAFHDHREGKVTQGNVWNPVIVSGTAPGAAQDSFQYREEHGVKSLQIDDDNCDCLTSLSLGHGMCGTGYSTSYGPENVFGVDLLYDSYCQIPSPTNSLYLYFRDDDECAAVNCPSGYRCVDGINSATCVVETE
ncbi:uncharacterized protein LOC110982959 [Acanthaster planci]|uniref:Uncharacterized protein LOC110982959 n=1 Tax=Acanthaster planci TaxID=133434 RepID=A0A8B7YXR3_ACAPL|nr:uncharacterized protein LOC110982959 [Acanthaster planci]